MSNSYSNLTSAGKAAVLHEAKRHGCKIAHESNSIVVYDGDSRSCAEALAYNYDNGDGRGIFSDRYRSYRR